MRAIERTRNLLEKKKEEERSRSGSESGSESEDEVELPIKVLPFAHCSRPWRTRVQVSSGTIPNGFNEDSPGSPLEVGHNHITAPVSDGVAEARRAKLSQVDRLLCSSPLLSDC